MYLLYWLGLPYLIYLNRDFLVGAAHHTENLKILLQTSSHLSISQLLTSCPLL